MQSGHCQLLDGSFGRWRGARQVLKEKVMAKYPKARHLGSDTLRLQVWSVQAPGHDSHILTPTRHEVRGKPACLLSLERLAAQESPVEDRMPTQNFVRPRPQERTTAWPEWMGWMRRAPASDRSHVAKTLNRPELRMRACLKPSETMPRLRRGKLPATRPRSSRAFSFHAVDFC